MINWRWSQWRGRGRLQQMVATELRMRLEDWFVKSQGRDEDLQLAYRQIFTCVSSLCVCVE